MSILTLSVTALAAAGLSAAAVVLASRQRSQQKIDAERAEVETLRVRGLEAARNERGEHVAVAKRKADALRAEAQARASQAALLFESEDQRLAAREVAMERRRTELEEQTAEIDGQFDALKVRTDTIQAGQSELPRLSTQALEVVEGAAAQTRLDALTEVRRGETEEARVAAQKAARLMEETARATAEPAARRLIDVVCQRYGTAVPTERMINLVTLPPAGKLRDRFTADGHALLREITERTQVEFMVQDEGDDVFLRAPDPYIREIGRLTFERLLKERDLNEGAVARVSAKTAADLERTVRSAGKKAAEMLHVDRMHPEILHLVGKLLYRTSYTQNQWAHAIESAYLCGMIAEDMGADARAARRSALIHDIGKVLWAETEAVGSHAVSGAAFARAHGESPEIVHPIAAHHNDEKPETVLAHIVAAADALSGARPGARRATEEAYSMRIEDLERICESFRGIESHFVIQGGRELRIVVDQTRLDDLDAAKLSEQVAGRIEEELTFPGQIKVTVIRETRAQSIARF